VTGTVGTPAHSQAPVTRTTMTHVTPLAFGSLRAALRGALCVALLATRSARVHAGIAR